MSELVEAWDSVTGEKYPYLVPQHWFDSGLSGSLVPAIPEPVKTVKNKDK